MPNLERVALTHVLWPGTKELMTVKPLLRAALFTLALTAASPALAQIQLLASDPLLVSSYAGDVDETRSLLQRGASPYAQDAQGRTALIWASVVGHYDTIDVLLQFDRQPDHTDALGNSAMFYASDRGYVDVVELLIGAGANADSENRQGVTPLMIAAQNGHLDTVEALIAGGADINHTDFTGRTVLDWANDGRSRQISDRLREAGAS